MQFIKLHLRMKLDSPSPAIKHMPIHPTAQKHGISQDLISLTLSGNASKLSSVAYPAITTSLQHSNQWGIPSCPPESKGSACDVNPLVESSQWQSFYVPGTKLEVVKKGGVCFLQSLLIGGRFVLGWKRNGCVECGELGRFAVLVRPIEGVDGGGGVGGT